MSNAKTWDTGVSLTYINNNYIRNDEDVAMKEYTDNVGCGSAIVKTRYGTFGAIGNIDMQGYTLTNVLDPSDARDLATKQYVDGE